MTFYFGFGVALQHLNPEAVLERGYAIVTQADGSIVQDSRTLAIGDVLRVSLARGSVEASVTAKDELGRD